MTKKKTTATAAPKGRPPGSPNLVYEPIEEIPGTCPKCGSANLTKVPGSKVINRPLSGKTKSGVSFGRMTWTRKICQCRQTVIVKSYFPAS